MRYLYQRWFLKIDVFGGKQLTALPPWLHPVCEPPPPPPH